MANEKAERILQECRDTALFLQERSLKVNDTNVLGDTPLHLACHWDDAEGQTAGGCAVANLAFRLCSCQGGGHSTRCR